MFAQTRVVEHTTSDLNKRMRAHLPEGLGTRCSTLPALNSKKALHFDLDQTYSDTWHDKDASGTVSWQSANHTLGMQVESLKAQLELEEVLPSSAGHLRQMSTQSDDSSQASGKMWHLVLLRRSFRDHTLEEMADSIADVLEMEEEEALSKIVDASGAATTVISTFTNCSAASEKAAELRLKGLHIQVMCDNGLPGFNTPGQPDADPPISRANSKKPSLTSPRRPNGDPPNSRAPRRLDSLGPTAPNRQTSGSKCNSFVRAQTEGDLPGVILSPRSQRKSLCASSVSACSKDDPPSPTAKSRRASYNSSCGKDDPPSPTAKSRRAAYTSGQGKSFANIFEEANPETPRSFVRRSSFGLPMTDEELERTLSKENFKPTVASKVSFLTVDGGTLSRQPSANEVDGS